MKKMVLSMILDIKDQRSTSTFPKYITSRTLLLNSFEKRNVNSSPKQWRFNKIF